MVLTKNVTKVPAAMLQTNFRHVIFHSKYENRITREQLFVSFFLKFENRNDCLLVSADFLLVTRTKPSRTYTQFYPIRDTWIFVFFCCEISILNDFFFAFKYFPLNYSFKIFIIFTFIFSALNVQRYYTIYVYIQ